MNRLSVYIFLIIVFLGLSKNQNFNLEGQQIIIKDSESLSKIFKMRPLSIVLMDYFSTGLIIRTYYHKYRFIQEQKAFQTVTIQVSRNFFNKNRNNIGMSIFRKNIRGQEGHLVAPPGALFIGNTIYGAWKKNLEIPGEEWIFYPPYKDLQVGLGLEDYVITKPFYEQVRYNIILNRPYYGPDQEFGINGSVSKKKFPDFFRRKKKVNPSLKEK